MVFNLEPDLLKLFMSVLVATISYFAMRDDYSGTSRLASVTISSFAITYFIYSLPYSIHPIWFYPLALIVPIFIIKYIRNRIRENLEESSASGAKVEAESNNTPYINAVSYMVIATLILAWGNANFNNRVEEVNSIYVAEYQKGYFKGCNSIINYVGKRVMYYDGYEIDFADCVSLMKNEKEDRGKYPISLSTDDFDKGPYSSRYDISESDSQFSELGYQSGLYNAAKNLFRIVPVLCYGEDCINEARFMDYYFPLDY
jgi:hypothetical protein